MKRRVLHRSVSSRLYKINKIVYFADNCLNTHKNFSNVNYPSQIMTIEAVNNWFSMKMSAEKANQLSYQGQN